jgi:hypothetical protein
MAATKRQQQRALALDRPRTVAEARAQAASGASREEVLAARTERRKKTSAVRPSAGPARYRRKPPAQRGPSGAAPVQESTSAVPEDLPEYEADLYDPTYEGETEAIDPLDAQKAGLHDEALELGHEEITLNLDDAETEGESAAGERPAIVKGE